MIDITHLLPHITKKKVLLQLSGGKDSLACMILLKEQGVALEAIHFVHSYNYSLPTEMAKQSCEKFGVRLHIMDVSNELSSMLLNGFVGRPCRHCKAIMDRITVEFASDTNHQLICIGDTGEDTMLINRLLSTEGKGIILSRYINNSVNLPKNISVIRPLLNYQSDDIVKFVQSKYPNFKRVHDTGDKYFDYSREGCPLQFKDMGAEYTEDIMKKLKTYNTFCTEFAMSHNIRASIHLPSEFIVTIPKGYEDECRKYLIDKGCKLIKKQLNKTTNFVVTAHVRTNGITLSSEAIKNEIFMRFIERLGLKNFRVIEDVMNIHVTGDCFEAECHVWAKYMVSIAIFSSFPINQKKLENLCMEIFHTYDFHVSNIKI